LSVYCVVKMDGDSFGARWLTTTVTRTQTGSSSACPRSQSCASRSVALAFRVPEEMAEAIDREAERLQRERPGSTVHRSDVVREVLHRALMGEK
jgi:hypothetical protein